MPVKPRTAPTTVEESEDEEELFVIEMEDEDGNPVEYYTNNDNCGDIYEVLPDESIGPKVGEFKDGEPEMFE